MTEHNGINAESSKSRYTFITRSDVTIQAVRVSQDNFAEVTAFIDASAIPGASDHFTVLDSGPKITLHLTAGGQLLSPAVGDYIVKGEDGALTVINGELFKRVFGTPWYL